MTGTSNLGGIFDEHQHNTNAAVIEASGLEDRSFSFSRLVQDIDRVARFIPTRIKEPGQHIIIAGENSYACLVAIFGVIKSGAVAIPLNVKLTESQLVDIVADCAPKGAIVDDEYADAPFLRHWTGERFSMQALLRSEESNVAISVETTAGGIDPALVLYTSGSTGRPKGVVLSHNSQVSTITGANSPSSPFAQRSCIIVAPLYHMNALLMSALMLHAGATIILKKRLSPEDYLDTIDRYGVNIMGGVPTMIAKLAKFKSGANRPPSPSVDLCLLGSAPLTERITEQAKALFPNAVVQNSYGTTEIGGGIFGSHPDGKPRPISSIGYPNQPEDIRLDGDGPDNGVLKVRISSNFIGYLNQPDLTAKKVTDGWYDTGDIFRRDADGFFYYVGRADDMFVCNGENIYPADVEKYIESHPDVLQSAVIAIDDHQRGQAPVAFVVARPSSTLTVKDVKAHALEHGPAYQHPRHVFFVEALPLTSVNKIDKRALTKQAIGLLEL